MANVHIDHHLALLQHLRTILVALGEAEQILEMRKREGIRGRVSVSVYLQQQ